MIKIRTWKKTSKLDKDTNNLMDLRQVTLIPMLLNDPDYIPQDNARQLARLFTESLPGNTIDIFYDHIADYLIDVINTSPELLDKEFISNHARIAINHLAYGE